MCMKRGTSWNFFLPIQRNNNNTKKYHSKFAEISNKNEKKGSSGTDES